MRRVLLAATAAVAAAVAGTVVVLTTGSPAGAVAGCVSPPDFAHSIPAPVGGPAAAPIEGGVAYATIGGDRKVYTAYTDITTPDLAVSTLACLGGGAVDTPATARYYTGQAFFVLAPNGRIYQKYLEDGGPLDTPWTIVAGAPAAAGSPAVVAGPSGGLSLFVRGTNGQVYTTFKPAYSGPDEWRPWQSLGGAMVGTPAVGLFREAQVVLVVRAPNGALYMKVGNSLVWNASWTKLAGTSSASPTLAGGFAAARLDLFVTGTTGGLYQSTYTAANGMVFSPFRKVDSELPRASRPAAAGQDGRMIVYATAPDGSVGYQQYVPGSGWLGFAPAPYTCDDVCLPVGETSAAGTRPVERASR